MRDVPDVKSKLLRSYSYCRWGVSSATQWPWVSVLGKKNKGVRMGVISVSFRVLVSNAGHGLGSEMAGLKVRR